MKKAPIALLFALCSLAILSLPANAVQIHKHLIVHRAVGGLDPGAPVKVAQEAVRVVDVAPPDRDDDGCPDAKDSYNGPGCSPPPKPAPVAAPVQSVAPAPATTSVATASGSYTIPSYIVSCESGGNYSAVNPSSGAYGAYQIMPSTASAYGCDLSTASGQDQCAASIYADVGASAWSCG